MSELITALCAALEDHIADEEVIREIYMDVICNIDLYDAYFIHDIQNASDFFKEVYEESQEQD